MGIGERYRVSRRFFRFSWLRVHTRSAPLCLSVCRSLSRSYVVVHLSSAPCRVFITRELVSREFRASRRISCHRWLVPCRVFVVSYSTNTRVTNENRSVRFLADDAVSSAMIIPYVCGASFFSSRSPLSVYRSLSIRLSRRGSRRFARSRPCLLLTRETPRCISSIFKRHGLSARGSASIYKASGRLLSVRCAIVVVSPSKTRYPHRTRICHQINTMSSRCFLPSSPSFDLFLALSVSLSFSSASTFVRSVCLLYLLFSL